MPAPAKLSAEPHARTRAMLLLIPFAALLATLPMILKMSCGQDLGFHMQSWLEAAQQLRHGHYPHWAFSAAYEAGEPRFLFYPPISWLLGALLTTMAPMAASPSLYVWIALTAAGFAMYRLAIHFAAPYAALLAACLYLANPYMLLNAFDRAAEAEILSSAWVPLLFLGILRAQPTVPGIAIPLALLWLTNAPSAVSCTYAFVLLAALRIAAHYVPFSGRLAPSADTAIENPWQLARTCLVGLLLGLALPAFYLIPAAYERRFVQIAMAIIPNMRYQDSFLFGRTNYAAHNDFTHTVSVLAVGLLIATAIILAALFVKLRQERASLRLPLALTIVLLTVTFMLVPISAPFWEHLPELKFLQFPWRLLTVLSSAMGLALALLFTRFTLRPRTVLPAAPIAVLALAFGAYQLYSQECEPEHFATFALSCFRTDHGVLPTDEYTPNGADNDQLRPNDPAYWLSDDVNAQAAGTAPNPNATDPDYDGPIPLNITGSARAPLHLALNLPQPTNLILHLRDFPGWNVTRNGSEHPAHLQRDDGLIALALPEGVSTIDIAWKSKPDQYAGLAVSFFALIALGVSFRRSRKIYP